MTVAQLVAGDIRSGRLKPLTRRARIYHLRNQILPDLGAVRADSLRRPQVEAWHRRRFRAAPAAALSALNALSAAWTRAARRGELPDENPCRGVRRRRLPGRERFLTDAEFGRLGSALDEFGGPEADAVRLIVLTGCRAREVLTLDWPDLRDGHLHLRDGKTGPRKVWLSASARDVLDSLPRAGGNAVFTGRAHARMSYSALFRAWKGVRLKAGLPRVRLHDLRHSYASVGLRMGAPTRAVQHLLGHAQIETTMRYSHADADLLSSSASKAAEALS